MIYIVPRIWTTSCNSPHCCTPLSCAFTGRLCSHLCRVQLLVSRALKAGCLNAAKVGFVAVHGTGTPLGDPIEVGALAGALAGAAPTKPPVLGSVKVQPCWADHIAPIVPMHLSPCLRLQHDVRDSDHHESLLHRQADDCPHTATATRLQQDASGWRACTWLVMATKHCASTRPTPAICL